MNYNDQGARPRYAGFISYSQKDKVWAKRIHKALETYRLPIGLPGEVKAKRKLGRFFRDDDELSGAPSLGDALDAAIDGSGALIVICSPNSAKSKWVDAEIRRFKRRGPDARVLAIIVGGRPDPEDPNEQCFPPSLLVKVNPDGTLTDEPDEPLAPDVRKDSFPRLITRLVAGLMDVEFDTLWQREKRRVTRLRMFAGSAIMALLLSFAGLYGWKQNQIASQAKQASVRALTEKSELLTGIADGKTASAEYTQASLLALESINHAPEFLGDRAVSAANIIAQLAKIKEEKILIGHEDIVYSVSFHPNGKTVATASLDGSVRIWNLASGAEISHIKAAQFGAVSASYSPNGQHIVTANGFSSIDIWDTNNGEKTASYNADKRTFYQANYSPDGQSIIGASGGENAYYWDLNNEQGNFAFEDQYAASLTAKFNMDGTKVVTSSDDETARIWDAHTGKEILSLKGHTDTLSDASFSPDGQLVVTAADDGTARIWDGNTGETIAVMSGHNGPVLSAIFSPDGRTILTASADKTARIWNVDTGVNTMILSGHTKAVNAAAYSPDGRTIVTASSDNTARIWNIAQMKMIALPNDEEGESALAISQSGKYLFVRNYSGEAHIWDAKTQKYITVYNKYNGIVDTASFSNDAVRVALVDSDNVVHIVDTSGSGAVSQITYDNNISSIGFSPDDKHIIIGFEDGMVRVSHIDTKQEVSAFKAHEDRIYAAVFSPDGRFIATSSSAPIANIWDAQTGQKISSLNGHSSFILFLAISPDSRLVITGADEYDKTARIWNLKTGQELAKLTHGNMINAAGFSPDGKLAVTASEDGTVRIWDTPSGAELSMLYQGDNMAAANAVFSNKGGTIMMTSYDKPAQIWHIPYVFSAALPRGAKENIKQAGLSGTPLTDSQRIDIETARQAWMFAAGAKAVPRCLTPDERKSHKLPADPPCWCQEKSYPSLAVWEDDYLARHPELLSVDGKPPEGTEKPNPFTHVRGDMWTCPAAGTGYSAPWTEFKDLNALSARELLGPANRAYEKLETLGINR